MSSARESGKRPYQGLYPLPFQLSEWSGSNHSPTWAWTTRGVSPSETSRIERPRPTYVCLSSPPPELYTSRLWIISPLHRFLCVWGVSPPRKECRQFFSPITTRHLSPEKPSCWRCSRTQQSKSICLQATLGGNIKLQGPPGWVDILKN